jgi:predicted TPR repeat methyltransferase
VTEPSAADWFDRGVAASNEGRHAEAQAAFQAALAIDSHHGEAHFGLGLTLMAERRFADAAPCLRRAVETPEAPAIWWTCLGQALYMSGAFADSVAAFDGAAKLEPLLENAGLTRAQALTFATMIDGRVEDALAPHGDNALAVAQEAFAVFGVFGHLDAARAVGAWIVAQTPSDPIPAYMLQVLADPTVSRAPPAYVEAHFDAFADRFDHQLVELLDYRAPELMADLLAQHADGLDEILDLGCGTGLSAAPLARFGGRLTGVDLSGAMLAKAAERQTYGRLVQADAVAFLREHPGAFDLVFSADVLIYFGDLADLLSAATQALRPGGYLAISIELSDQDWTVLTSGRFAHGDAYVRGLLAPAFDLLARQAIPLRREGSGVAEGALYILRRR